MNNDDAVPASSPGVTYQAHEGEQVVTDPVRIRALAHPFRLQLLDYLSDVPQATATECAEALNESVASCSFHLRTLAKHGYIEPAARNGREKPWKVVSSTRSQSIDREQPGSVHAVSTLASMHVSRETERIQDWLGHAPAQQVEDIDFTTVHSNSFYLTHEEMAELREELLTLAQRFDGRWADPGLRPEGSKPARLFAVLNFDPNEEP